MQITQLKKTIESIWRSNQTDLGDKIDLIKETISLLNNGVIKICEKFESGWTVNDWMRQAILLYFRITNSSIIDGGYYDKVPLKFINWTEGDFIKSRIRVVPGAIVRYGSFVAPGCIIMTSFINIGAYVGENSMVDINATLGSCCHIGKNCHIGANSVIGGVLEPMEEKPVIIGDGVFIGACCSITSGVIVDDGAVIAPGTHISKSTRIYDTTSGEISYGIIPKNAVVIPGTMPRSDNHNVNIACAIIIKYADDETRKKVSINDLLRT